MRLARFDSGQFAGFPGPASNAKGAAMSLTIHRRAVFGPLLAGLFLAACTETPGEISRDATPFNEVEEAATISALGTEPFWGLKVEPVDGGYQATFSSPDTPDGEVSTVTRFAGNNGLGFSGERDGEAVSLALTPGDCSDAMSDRTYPYTATLLMGETTLYGCAYTSDEPYTGEEAP